MPLKPGQKQEIKIKVEKIKGLQTALKKAKEYEAAMANYSHPNPTFSKNIQDKIKALKSEIEKEYNLLKSEIATLKQQNAKNNKGAEGGPDKLVKAIAKECSQVIPVYKKTKRILLRGTDTDMRAFVGRSRNNRQTKDSNQDVQAVFDAYLKSQKFKALRGNSIFTSTDFNQAGSYGEVFFIYPKNGFAFHWYEETDDLVLDSWGQVYNFDKIESLWEDGATWYEKKYPNKDLAASLQNYDMDNDGPAKLIAILQKLGYPKAAKLTPAHFIDGPGIRLDIAPTQKDFATALKNGGEVCIAGEYYAIKANTELATYINKQLGIKVTNYDIDDDYEDTSSEFKNDDDYI